MPELPEVEVLRRSLEPRLVGRRLVTLLTCAPALREPLDRRRLQRLAVGRTVVALRRRAKYLLIDLERGSTLVIHLGMTGQLTVVAGPEAAAPHEHLAFLLDSGERLRLVDPRRFGVAFVAPTAELASESHLRHLGVEPLGEELDGAFLARLAHGRRGPVKSFLMDGRQVVGVGNIYACESLWRAKIHPGRSVARISRASWERLATTLRAVLTQAIGEGGTTLNDFMDGLGNAGWYQVSLSVYGRAGEPCPACGRTVRRTVQGGRSTFYCPGCQR